MYHTTKKKADKKLKRACAICAKQIAVIVHPDKTYRGGHYFGKTPLHRKSELRRALKAGTHTARIGAHTMNVLNKDPKPYAYTEYWECPKCYWKG